MNHNEQFDMSPDMADSVKKDVANIGPLLMQGKIDQQKVLAESAAQGGPTTVQNAFAILLDHAKIGLRDLSRRIGVPRKKLEKMINGEVTMPPEVIKGICDAIELKHPGMLDRLEKLV